MTRSPVWHPFTQHALAPEIPHIDRAEGAYLYTSDGRRIFDAISSWWVITHGHCHPHIVAAIREQAGKLDQVIFAGHTHEPAERLARKLVDITPPGLDYVFFSDSGSTSVEVALKMALGYWRNGNRKGGAQTRHRILALEHGYHGDTIGAMSVGARSVFNEAYEPLLFEVGRVPFPAPGREQYTLDALEMQCQVMEAAALIVEPLVLGAGGMRMYPARVLAEMKRICERHKVLFIADEVMTAWGRTGSLFACEQAGIVPDIACYAKGLTGGSLPLAVTMCRAEIFDAHYSTDREKTFFHSSSYTANPIACAAAVANLEVWEREPVRERIAAIGAHHEQRLDALKRNRGFTGARRCGTIVALELEVKDPGYLAEAGPKLYEYFRSRGLLLRPLGNTIYLMPPYCSTLDDLDAAYDAIESARV
jgi:adenosylmethionine-8-amino-7-oxononanoate aminotransferase